MRCYVVNPSIIFTSYRITRSLRLVFMHWLGGLEIDCTYTGIGLTLVLTALF